jgi:hypothetical protein
MVAKCGLWTASSLKTIQLFCFFIHGKCPSPQELFGVVVVVHINKRSQKWSLVWLVDHLLHSKKKKKKKAPKQDGFFLCSKRRKKLKIKN